MGVNSLRAMKGRSGMGKVLRFPVRHGRAASADSRAARRVQISALRPCDVPHSVSSTDAHHSAGMLSLCHHFDTAADLAPISAAIASRDGQSSMIDRKEGVSVIPPAIRQSVLNCKDILSADLAVSFGQTVLMAATSKSASDFKNLWIARTKAAREKSGKSQDVIAAEIGVPQPTYAKYETRTMLPHQYVMAFCALCDITPAWMYTAAVAMPEAKPKRKRRRLAA
jgi:DNA-binding transcriptional regulator YiaG